MNWFQKETRKIRSTIFPVCWPTFKAPNSSQNDSNVPPPMSMNSFFEMLLLITTDIETAKVNPALRFFPELSDILKQLNGDNSQEINMNNFETCLFEVLKTEDGLFFEDFLARFNYLEEIHAIISKNIHKGSLPKEDVQEIQKTVSGYSLNLVVSPWIFGKEQPDEKLVEFFCERCFKGANAFSSSFFWGCFAGLNEERDKEKTMVLLNAICNFDIKKGATTTKEQMERINRALLFLIELFQRNPYIFQVFTDSSHSIGADLIKNEEDPVQFMARSFVLKFLNVSFFPWESQQAIKEFLGLGLSTFQRGEAAASKKSMELHELVFDPFCRFLELFLSKNDLTEQVVSWAERILILNKNKLRIGRRGPQNQTNGFPDGFFFNFVFVMNSLVGGFIPVDAKYNEIFDKWLDSSVLIWSEVLEKIGESSYNDLEAVKKWREFNQVRKREEMKAACAMEERKEEQVNSDRAFGSRLFVVASYANHLLGNIWNKYFVFARFLSSNDRNILLQATCCSVHLMDSDFIRSRVFIGILESLAFSRLILPEGEAIPEKIEGVFSHLFERNDLNLELGPVFLIENIHQFIEALRTSKFSWIAETLQGRNPEMLLFPEFFTVSSELLLACIGSKHWCVNPHLRAKIIETIGLFMLQDDSINGSFEYQRCIPQIRSFFTSSRTFQRHGVQSLMTFFIDIEKTGSHNQFFEKFRPRHSFFLCLNHFRKELPGFKKAFLSFMSNDRPKAMRFLNLLLNDLVFLLDDGLAKISEIKRLEQAMTHPQEPSMNIRQTIAQEHVANVRMATSIFAYLYSNYEALLTISSCTPELLLSPEILDKLCMNINYSMVKFHSPDSHEKLKIRNPKKTNFYPDRITGSLGRVLIILKDFPEIYEGLVRDGRSFSLEIYNLTGSLFYGQNILNNSEIRKFEEFFEKLEKKHKEAKAFDKRIEESEIPEEFLDPIMHEIMREPVLLPTSNKIVDRLTIVKHLLSDPSDPFNRQPLEITGLVPQKELKEKIDEFLKGLLINESK